MERDAKDFGTMFFSAHGRMGRKDFWLAWLVQFAVGILFVWIPLIGIFIWLAKVYSRICIYAKRLHDMGRSGWLQVVPIVAHVVAGIIGVYFAAVIALTALGFAFGGIGDVFGAVGIAVSSVVLGSVLLAAFLIELGFLLWIGISEPDPYENQYGPAPYDSPEPEYLRTVS